MCLTVENSGVPIAVDRWETIFEPFQRGSDEQGASMPGWGVGLAFAKVVVDKHGGSIGVAASNADGTVFKLILPTDSRPVLNP